MKQTRRRVVFRPSPMRIGIWVVLAAIVAVLAFQIDPGPIGDRLEEAQRAAADGAAEGDSEQIVPPGGPDAPPTARFGVLARASHVVPLMAAGMGLLDAAVQASSDGVPGVAGGWVQLRVFQSSHELARALENGELDLATVPLRTAAALAVRMGDAAPKVVSGSALGDERFVLKREDLQVGALGGLRVGVVESPTLDLNLVLADSAVVLTPAAALSGQLLRGELDAALAPEPMAGAAAMGSKATLAGAEAQSQAGVIGGAVLVMTSAFLDERPGIAANLVAAHESTARYALGQGPDHLAEQVCAVLADEGVETAPPLLWSGALSWVHVGTDLPEEELSRLVLLAAAEAGAPAPPPDSFLTRALLTRARAFEAELDER